MCYMGSASVGRPSTSGRDDVSAARATACAGPRQAATSRALRRLALQGLCMPLLACSGGNESLRQVTIPPGSSFKAASDSLASAGLVSAPTLFRFYAKVLGRDREIKAGTYLLPEGASWWKLVDILASGRDGERPVTIPEGYNTRDIAHLLARSLLTPVESVHAATRDTALLKRLTIPTGTLEGYLFPDTYRFGPAMSARDAVREMVRRFEEVWQDEWDERLGALGMDRHDIITLASIIEKEARVAEERPVISAVYHNRLRAGMPLQADPTVQYALGRHQGRLFYRDLEINSPYNTYKHPGLPPGPIASPGRASIEAALNPAKVPYRYFVARPDGRHEFRVTFEEHTRARREVQRSRGSAGRNR
jgi:UPF0755 protein